MRHLTNFRRYAILYKNGIIKTVSKRYGADFYRWSLFLRVSLFRRTASAARFFCAFSAKQPGDAE